MGPIMIVMLAMAAGVNEGKQVNATAPTPPFTPPPRVMVPPPAPPPPLIAKPRPTGPNLEPSPISSPGSYVGSWDYPAKALREKRSGSTTVELAVSRWGSVADCRVTASSGYEDLDIATCERLASRARFWPATDAQSRPIAGTYSQTVRWALPEPSVATGAPSAIMTVPVPAPTMLFPRPPRLKSWNWANLKETDWPQGAREAGRKGEAKVSFDIDAAGSVTGCRVMSSSGHPDLDARSCAIVRERATFEAALGLDGQPAASRGEQLFVWREPASVSGPIAPRPAEWRNRPAMLPAFMTSPGNAHVRIELDKEGKVTDCKVDWEGGMKGLDVMGGGFCREAREKGFRSADPTKNPLPREIEVTLQVKTTR